MTPKTTPLSIEENWSPDEHAIEFMELLPLREDLPAPEYVRVTMRLSKLLRDAQQAGLRSVLDPMMDELLKKKDES